MSLAAPELQFINFPNGTVKETDQSELGSSRPQKGKSFLIEAFPEAPELQMNELRKMNLNQFEIHFKETDPSEPGSLRSKWIGVSR